MPKVFSYWNLKAMIDHGYDTLCDNHKLAKWVKQLCICNQKQPTTTAHYHNDLTERYLVMCGYVHGDVENDVGKCDQIENIGDNGHSSIEDIDVAKSILLHAQNEMRWCINIRKASLCHVLV